MGYQGQVVAVTGARKGLGSMLAEHFLERGATVVGLSRGPGSIAHERYRHIEVDITDDAAVRHAFVEVGRRLGRLDVLVNNASVLTSTHALLTAGDQAAQMVQTNLLGTLYVSREAAKLMRRGRYGRIVNIGSMAAVLEPVGDAVYAATKAGVVTLSAVLAKEFASFGVTVNTLGVTAIDTDMFRQLDRERVDAVIAALPLPRTATLADIAHVIDFFASRESDYVTAQAIYLGGVHA